MTVAGRFVKRPVEVEAVRFERADQAAVICAWGEGQVEAVRKATGVLRVRTLHGPTLARLGDWILRGPDGDYWPCEDAIFEASYASADA